MKIGRPKIRKKGMHNSKGMDLVKEEIFEKVITKLNCSDLSGSIIKNTIAITIDEIYARRFPYLEQTGRGVVP